MPGRRVIFISPHLDDAALCAGGWLHQLAKHGVQVEVWTVMSGFPPDPQLSEFASEMHSKWGTGSAEQTVSLRRAEDRAACSILGATFQHWEILDAIYRRDPYGEWLYANPVGAPVSPHDGGLQRAIAARLQQELQNTDTIVTPMGIGHHADHRLVRNAVSALGRSVIYVQDIPYALAHEELAAETVQGMHRQLLPMGEWALRAWRDAVLCYGSQLASLHSGGAGGLLSAIVSWVGRQGGLPVFSTGAPVPELD